MNFKKYHNATDVRMWSTYREEDRRLKELFKSYLFLELGIQDHPKREKLFELAWDHGHSAGYVEVYGYATDFMELLS